MHADGGPHQSSSFGLVVELVQDLKPPPLPPELCPFSRYWSSLDFGLRSMFALAVPKLSRLPHLSCPPSGLMPTLFFAKFFLNASACWQQVFSFSNRRPLLIQDVRPFVSSFPVHFSRTSFRRPPPPLPPKLGREVQVMIAVPPLPFPSGRWRCLSLGFSLFFPPLCRPLFESPRSAASSGLVFSRNCLSWKLTPWAPRATLD